MPASGYWYDRDPARSRAATQSSSPTTSPRPGAASAPGGRAGVILAQVRRASERSLGMARESDTRPADHGILRRSRIAAAAASGDRRRRPAPRGPGRGSPCPSGSPRVHAVESSRTWFVDPVADKIGRLEVVDLGQCSPGLRHGSAPHQQRQPQERDGRAGADREGWSSDSAWRSSIRMSTWFASNASTAFSYCFFQSIGRGLARLRAVQGASGPSGWTSPR